MGQVLEEGSVTLKRCEVWVRPRPSPQLATEAALQAWECEAASEKAQRHWGR